MGADPGGNGRELSALKQLIEEQEARDPALTSHSELVSLYAARTAAELGLPLERIERVMLAGTVHDLGKVTLPDSILFKPGSLDEHEWTIVRRHPEAGAWILSDAGFREVAVWVMLHHERMDGGGYPFGLAGSEIPLEARILAVADAYEAMTADRVYRASLGHDVACAELRRCTGTQFDPGVVEAFLAGAPGELTLVSAARAGER
ncbi:MAG: HD-GYP domain-containing protein [Actinomycetota bacterium]|nr:HD-GYP domain-containing protein [Actinomycetota bacterium]